MKNVSSQKQYLPSFQGYKQIPFLSMLWNWLTRPEYEYPPDYFLPGQVVLHLEHSPNISADVLANTLIKFLSGTPTTPPENQAKSSKARRTRGQTGPAQGPRLEPQGPSFQEQRWREKIQVPGKESIITIPLKNEAGLFLSIVPTQLNDPGMHGRELFHFIVSINNGLGAGGIAIGSGITLMSGSPNWLMSATHHGSATGGPGSWPVEGHPPLEEPQWKPAVTNGQGLNPLLPDARAGENVHVAILDTAPTQHALNTAYAEWRWQKHAVIDDLCRPKNRTLRLHPATETDFHSLHRTVEYSLVGHRHWMRDHGLFVAGLIHSLAPNATLHLYEVLNPFGVGTFGTIAQGLSKIISNREIKRPLVVNCSFALNVPEMRVLEEEFEVRPPSPLLLTGMTNSIKGIFERLTQSNIIVVAAAGNDSHGSPRKPTCYPAAFRHVFGVGAMQNPGPNGRSVVASYSNLADDQNPNEGYMMFGGEPGEGGGILGVYIDEFPVLKRVEDCLSRLWRWFRIGSRPRSGYLPARPGWLRLEDVEYERNTTGWAWWAGTSFAAAILAGTLAALPRPTRVLRNFTEAQKALDTLIQTNRTPQGEKVIQSSQRN